MKRAAGFLLFLLVSLSIGLAGCSGSNGHDAYAYTNAYPVLLRPF